MDSSVDKTKLISNIWAAAASMCLFFAVYGATNDGGVEAWVLAFPILMATLLTSAIWVSTVLIENRGDFQKAKRQPADKLALLKEMLDDDELETFKETLKASLLKQNDGELPYDEETLQALMHRKH
jgi:hypothetical protein